MVEKGGLPTGPLAKLGGAIALAGLSGLFPGVRDLLIAASAKYLKITIPEVPIWIAFVVLALGVALVVVDFLSNQGFGRVKNQVLALRHITLSDVHPAYLAEEDLPRRDGRPAIDRIDLDLTNEMSHGHTEILAAVDKQQRAMREIAVRLRANPRPRLAYYGVAHIPFQLWAGCQLTHAGAYLYELIRGSGAWRELSTDRVRKFSVHVQKTNSSARPTSLVIRIAVSFPVDLADVRQVVSDPFDDVLISVAMPQRDLITHYKQAEAIAAAFKEVLDLGMQRLPAGGSVHVFYAGPMSVGFELGRQVSVSNHPAVMAYNHTRQSVPRYAWAICINRPEKPDILRFPSVTLNT